jgi:apolipoprotein N-acyltransferase
VKRFDPRYAAAGVAGALLACAFAPLGWWPLAILCPAILIALWQGATPRRAAWIGFWFNAATFAAGTYWLYISIHLFGGAPVWIAMFLMIALVIIMGLYHALLGYCIARWLPATGLVRWLLAIPAAWVFIEWWRGWFLSGFSWLSLGYSQTDTWLKSFAPVAGVYGISALLLVCAGAVAGLVVGKGRQRVIAGAVLVLPWIAAAALARIEWTHPSGQAVTLAILQGSVPQEAKWLESNRDTTLKLYHDLTLRGLGRRLIVMPESAPPDLANNIVPWIKSLYKEARDHGSGLVFGVVRASDDGKQYFNSVLALDERVSWYDKTHLVPFAEFFPVPGFVRSWLRLMSLPYSDFTHGADDQPPLPAGGLKLGTTICYEDAYGSSMLRVLRPPQQSSTPPSQAPSDGPADALVNVTNDAWFGHSTARYQHFQIARMRAIEAQRFLIRAANNGVSAVIGPHGEVVARAPEFTPYVLESTVVPRTGLPPYARVGNFAVVGLSLMALAYGVWVRQCRGPRAPSERPDGTPPTGTPSAAATLSPSESTTKSA